jgi:hypothetical protein
VGKPVRPILIVKIDNAPEARPQAGLNQADVVVEEMVEGGLTRFAALYHSADADLVGPVRSARSTDVTFAISLNKPLFAYSGANGQFQALVSRSPLIDVGIDKFASAYSLAKDRRAPHNLFTSTNKLWTKAPDTAQAPPALFTYRDVGAPSAASGAAPAASATVAYGTTTAVWTWDAASSTWLRAQNGTPHNDATGKQVGVKNVVIQLVRYRNSGLVDPARNPVPEALLVGDGEAWVLTDGKLVKGKWSRPTQNDVTTFVDAAGSPIALTPGQSWLELAPPGTASSA